MNLVGSNISIKPITSAPINAPHMDTAILFTKYWVKYIMAAEIKNPDNPLPNGAASKLNNLPIR